MQAHSGEIGRRVVVVGTTGSGKTTLARGIALKLGVPHIELDALHWGPNWTPAPADVFRERVDQALSGDGWVVDGNYRKVRDITWARAETIVWLDFTLPTILRQLTRRTLARIITRESLWGTNRESFRGTFMSRDSLYVWVLQTYRRHRVQYPETFAQPEYAHLTVVRLRSPRQARRWLKSLPEHR